MVRAGAGSTPLSVHQRRCLRTAASAARCGNAACLEPAIRSKQDARWSPLGPGGEKYSSDRIVPPGEVCLKWCFRRPSGVTCTCSSRRPDTRRLPAACPECLRLLRPRQTSTILRHSSGERSASSASALSAATASGLHWSQASQLHGEHSQKASPCGMPLLHTLQVPNVAGATTAVRGGPEGHALAEH